MTKRSRIAYVGPVELGEIMQHGNHRCAWKGCTASTPLMKDLPPGWRWLLLWPDTVQPVPTFAGILAVAERDAALCPKHADLLHNQLLEDIGQRLHQTEGSA